MVARKCEMYVYFMNFMLRSLVRYCSGHENKNKMIIFELKCNVVI